MKLRIRGNSLRLRLTRTEVADFAVAGFVEDRVQLGMTPDGALVFRLEASDAADQPEVSFCGNRICVRLPRTEAVAWTRGDGVGIYAEESWGLKLSVEKDFKCLDPRLDEDESDAFENPHGTSHAACAATPD